MLKVLTAAQIREADAFTIRHEPVSGIELMERSAAKCVQWINNIHSFKTNFKIFCGNGNNGGDGLAIARLLYLKGKNIEVFVSGESEKYSPDFKINYDRLKELKSIGIKTIEAESDFPLIKSDETVIDAIVGTGLNRPVEGIFAALIDHINHSNCEVISIDIPSGLSPDHSVKSKTIMARNTLTFQFPKLTFFYPENSNYTGSVHILDIGLKSPRANAYFQ